MVVFIFLYRVPREECLVSGLGTMFSGYGGVTFQTFILGLLTMFGGAIGARIWCELMMVIFKINENLQVLKDTKVNSEA